MSTYHIYTDGACVGPPNARVGGYAVIGHDDTGVESREGVDRQGRLVPARYIHLFQRKTLVNREKVFVMKKRNLSSIMVVVVLTMGG